MKAWHPFSFAMLLPLLLGGCDDGAGRIDTACRTNSDCAATELCATGVCEDGLGECEARPTTCEDEAISTVCGCDGRTYPNTCSASLNGIRLAQEGSCNCATNDDCVGDQYCALADSCTNVGGCEPRADPECIPEPPVVCGCDGQTYDNSCVAAEAGARVSAEGPCDCEVNEDCAAGEFCSGLVCAGPGSCQVPASGCMPEDPIVTGCDGVVYENVCAAEAAGTRVRPI